MNEVVVPLAGARNCREGIASCAVSDAVALSAHPEKPGGLLATGPNGMVLGHFTDRHAIARELAGGAVVLHASVNSTTMPSDQSPGEVRVRIVTGQPGERYEPPPPPSPRPYKVGIVGEGSYQKAISRCRVGEPVRVVHEIGNPHDRKALAIETGFGATIGYIARDHWLSVAIHDEGQGCSASIMSIANGGGGQLGVVLDVGLIDGPIATRCYAPSRPAGLLARLFGG